MPVTETLMGPGDFTVQLIADAPTEIRRLCQPGANILITAVDLGDEIPDHYDLADLAIYNSLVLDRRFAAGEISGQGLLGYLESEKGYAGVPSAGGHGDLGVVYPATISTIMAAWFNGGGQSNGLRSGTAYSATATTVRELDQFGYMPPFKGPLDTIMAQTGNEYRCLPSGYVDWGVATSLFRSSPLVGIYPGHAGREAHSGYTLLDGAEVDVLETYRSFRNQSEVAASDGSYTVAYTASGSPTRWYPDTDFWLLATPQLVEIDSTNATDVDNLSVAIADKYDEPRREITISVTEYCVPKLLVPGDWIGLYDLANDIYDLTNQVDVEGGPIFPENIRCVGYTWPILRGMGVYVHYAGVLTRITDHVEFENDDDGNPPPTDLVIGDPPQPLVPSAFASLVD